LWCHYSEAAPLGRALWIAKRDGKSKTKAKFQFDDDEFSDLIFRKYQSGSMSAFSIRFDPDYEQSGYATPDEIKANKAWKDAYIYRKSVLLEVSAVAVPGNANCLAEDVSRGLIAQLPDDVKEAITRLSIGGGKGTTRDGDTDPTPPTPTPPPAIQLPSLAGARTYDQVVAAALHRLTGTDASRLARESYQQTIDRLRGRV
jgi:hypothetical protein